MKDDFVKLAQDALEQEKYRRHEIPQLIKRLLESDQWKERNPNEKLLEPKTFRYFPAFVEEAKPWGLGIEWSFVQELCKGYEDVELSVAKAITGESGKHIERGIGAPHTTKTEKQRNLMRLERERPDLLDRVQKKELSTQAAMIEAGLITPKIKAVKKPENVAEMIRKHFTPEEIAKIIKILMG